MSLLETFRYHARVLAAKSGALEVIRHAGNRGAEREIILEEFLLPLLPHRIAIGKGEIQATNGEWSRQEDLILYDRLNCPRLFVGGQSQIFPIESVGAVIEVKTNLGTTEIAQATENISKLKNLEKSGLSTHIAPGGISFGPPSPTLGCLFAYDTSLKDDTFKRRWCEAQLALPPAGRINLVCVLNKYVIIHINNDFHLWDNIPEELLESFVFIEGGEDSLLIFILDLMRVLAEARFGVPDLFKYLFTGGQSLNLSIQHFKRV